MADTTNETDRANAAETEAARLREELARVTRAQVSRADLAGMTPAAIETARREGRLSDALKGNA